MSFTSFIGVGEKIFMIEAKLKESPLEWIVKSMENKEALTKIIQKTVEDNIEKGLNVYMADDTGIYQLQQKGSKKYVELFS